MYAGQERRLNSFHLRSIRRILVISLQDKVTNADVLSRAGLPTMYTLLRHRRLRWLGHVRRMEDGRIPKDILYGELALGRRTTGRPHLRYKDVCIRDMKAVDIDTVLGGPCGRSNGVEECSETTPQDRGRQTDDCSSGQASTQKGGQQLHPTRNNTWM